MFAFSFVWWESNIVLTDLGFRLDGLGVASGYSIHINFLAAWWVFSSNSRTLDMLFQDTYATIPGGGLFPGVQSVSIEVGQDECNVFPLLRMRDTGVPSPVEHIARFPPNPPSYWYQPGGRPVPFPRRVPYPRVSPCVDA